MVEKEAQVTPTSLFGILSADSVVRWGMGVSALLLLGQWLLLGFFVWQLPPEIPLFFSLPTGSQQLANRSWYLILPSLSIVIFVVHLVLIRFSSNYVKVYGEIIAWGAALAIFLATIAMINVVQLAL